MASRQDSGHFLQLQQGNFYMFTTCFPSNVPAELKALNLEKVA